MRRIFTILAFSLCCSSVSWAVPAFRAKKKVTLDDGTMLEVSLKGDESFHFWQADDGRAVKLQPNGYARFYTEQEFQDATDAVDQVRSQDNVRRLARRRNYIGKFNKLEGKKKCLVILMQYADVQFKEGHNLELFRDMFNKEGYTDNDFTGSVSDYFKAQSYGKFEIDFDVVGPYTAKYKMSYYGGNDTNGNDINPRALIEEGLMAADAEVNYKDYDWDGDGEVEQVFVLYAGYGPNFGGNEDNIWPHESRLYRETPLKLDGVKLDTYACSCEMYGSAGNIIDGIGAACHEFSHCLGYPDFYDTSKGDNYGMGDWDIMAGGNYNNMSRTPISYSSYERWMAGWLTPVEINSETQIEDMKPITEVPEAYILYNDKNRNEYYMLENRQLQGFDAANSGHGLLVLHVDYDEGAWMGNTPNASTPERMTFIPADGRRDWRTEDGDLFPGTSGNTALTDVTTPAAELNNRNTDGQKLMHKSIERITEKDGLISMLVCAPLLSIPSFDTPVWKDEQTVELSWQPVDRAQGYELLLSGNPRKGSVEEAVCLDEDFAGCYKSSVGFSDIGTKMDSYTTNKGFSGKKLYQSPEKLRIGTSTTTGFLRSPVMPSLVTGDLTVALEVKPLKEGTKVKGVLDIVTNTAATNQELSFSFETATTLVLHSTVKFNERYVLNLNPESGMYISRLTLYDGNFSEEELGLAGKAMSPRRAAAMQKTVTTNDTHYTFEGLDPAYEYDVQIRATDDGRFSQWSDIMTFSNESAVGGISSDANISPDDAVYDLQGRPVAMPLRRGIYIVNGKKVMK